MKTNKPIGNGANGDGDEQRNSLGRFVPGNRGGPGAPPQPAAVLELRQAMIAAVSVDDLRAIVSKLVKLAVAGNVQAAREIFDRVLGRVKLAEDDAAIGDGRLEIVIRHVDKSPSSLDA